MRMYFQTESVARRFAQRSEAASWQLGRLNRGTAMLVVEDDDVSQPHCYQCDRQVSYLFPDGRCSRCTRVQPD